MRVGWKHDTFLARLRLSRRRRATIDALKLMVSPSNHCDLYLIK